MSVNLSFFEELARPGDFTFHYLAGGNSDSEAEYLELVAELYGILSAIHLHVVKAAVDVSETTSLEEAKNALPAHLRAWASAPVRLSGADQRFAELASLLEGVPSRASATRELRSLL